MAALRPGSKALGLPLCRFFSGGVGRLARERGTERRDAASSRVSGTPGTLAGRKAAEHLPGRLRLPGGLMITVEDPLWRVQILHIPEINYQQYLHSS